MSRQPDTWNTSARKRATNQGRSTYKDARPARKFAPAAEGVDVSCFLARNRATRSNQDSGEILEKWRGSASGQQHENGRHGATCQHTHDVAIPLTWIRELQPAKLNGV